jgi:myo-inositol-1(or 4)-monophosphatase
MADINLQEIHDFLVEIASKAGAMITSAKPSTGAAGSKKNCKYHTYYFRIALY